MFFSQSSGRRSARVQQRKLHTITGLSKEREFAGSFELGNAAYKFSYAPAKGELRDGKFYLVGRLSVTARRGRTLYRDGVRAVYAGIQGGLGTGPARPLTGAGVAEFEKRRTASTDPAPVQGQRPIPAIDSTDARAFAGVMYLTFGPIEGRALGVPADMSRVQLNARFYVIDDTARALHGIYCSIVDSIEGPLADRAVASALVEELNRKLA